MKKKTTTAKTIITTINTMKTEKQTNKHINNMHQILWDLNHFDGGQMVQIERKSKSFDYT